MEERFKCKDADYIDSNTPLDYLGMILMQDDTSTYLSMEPYIDNACRILEIKPAKRASTPISQPIDCDAPLSRWQRRRAESSSIPEWHGVHD